MTTTTKKRRGEGANYQFLPKQIREGRSILPNEKKVLGYIISKCIESDIYDNEGCMAISYDQLKGGAIIKGNETIQHTIKSLKAKGCITYIRGGHPGEANRYTLSRELTDMINQDEKKINFTPADDKNNIDMEQQAPEEKDYKKLYDSVYARFRNWIMNLSGMDSGKDGGKFIEEAVAFYRSHKDSNEQPVDEEKKQLKAENAQQKRAHERQIEELTDDIRGKEATIKTLKSDLKKATSGEVSLVVEPSTPYGGNVKLIQCN